MSEASCIASCCGKALADNAKLAFLVFNKLDFGNSLRRISDLILFELFNK